MKLQVIAIESLNMQGVSKKGNEYHIDDTRLTVLLPLDTAQGFGFKAETLRYGSSSNFAQFADLRGKLPLTMEIDIGMALDNYGRSAMVVNSAHLVK